MCGILFALIKHEQNVQKLSAFNNFFTRGILIDHRGPDSVEFIQHYNTFLYFCRLSINDTTSNGMQPFITFQDRQVYGVSLYKKSVISKNKPFYSIKEKAFTMCNGEIYNYKELLKILKIRNPKIQLKSNSDCEIIPHMIDEFGFQKTIKMLDGVFAIVHVTRNKIYCARDRLGVKPLFYGENNDYFCLSSEAKSLEDTEKELLITPIELKTVRQIEPATILQYNRRNNQIEKIYNYWSFLSTLKLNRINIDNNALADFIYSKEIEKLLIKSVEKRMSSDREIGCLLSGGVDSSIIASILSDISIKKGLGKIHTFSIGFADSTDIKYARKVAEHIKSEHHEYIISYDYAISRIPDVIQAIESCDVTTIRASTPMFLLCEWISEKFPHKVIFSGEGSDELFGGYLYFHKAPNEFESHKETLKLLKNLYKYDVLRAERCTSSNGLELREPFLDLDLIKYVVKFLPIGYKIPRKIWYDDYGVEKRSDIFEKSILRAAFSGVNNENIKWLPSSVIWRRKAAFSDAVSGNEKPWYKWIQEYCNKYHSCLESEWYKSEFNKLFNSYKHDFPLWLPNWTECSNEPSATILDIYNKTEH